MNNYEAWFCPGCNCRINEMYDFCEKCGYKKDKKEPICRNCVHGFFSRSRVKYKLYDTKTYVRSEDDYNFCLLNNKIGSNVSNIIECSHFKRKD